jgi:hypothetical protein
MKTLLLYFLSVLVTMATVRAQWYSQTYPLGKGWNGIWLSGDATYATVAEIFSEHGPKVSEVWRWNPNPDQTGFTGSPSTPTTSSEEWTVWKRDDPAEQELTQMMGNTSYLLRCDAATSLTLKQLALPPSATWLISGANFMGMPGFGPGDTTSPLLSTYLASFPSAETTVLSPTSKIYKYEGEEDLGANNPKEVQAGTERLNPGQAYWFESAATSDFTGPVEYELPSTSGLAFGRTLTAMTVGVTNRLTTAVTLTVRLEPSESEPNGQSAVPDGVVLMRRLFNSTTNEYDEIPMGGGFTVALDPSGRTNLDFGVDRSGITDYDAFHASILRITDSQNLMDVRLPVSVLAASSSGLWIAQAKVSHVGSTVPGATGTTTSQPFPLVFLIHLDANGVARMLPQVFVGKLDTANNPFGLCISEEKILSKAESGVVPRRYVSCQLPAVSYLTGVGALAVGSTVTWKINVPHTDPTNPFVHTYHPDHDNLDPSFSSELKSGEESYTIDRTCGFTFTSEPPNGSMVAGWGTTVLGGTYAELLKGLNGDQDLSLTGTFAMRRISEIATIDLTPSTP